MRLDSEHQFSSGLSESALSVSPGVSQPPSVNPNVLKRLRATRRRELSVGEYVEGILAGNVTVLSRAITLLESKRDEHYALSQEIISHCLPHSGRSFRVGITGVPGAGKSTLIETLGGLITSRGRRLAVLAIDPSSARSKGSILGDKTRMEHLSVDPRAFIRPSPSAGSLGGVARKTRETIIICEAAGYDTIFIETVGVGQSETAVHSMVDMFLLVLISGAGDELQGIKRGVMEMADLIAVNKADGDNMESARLAMAQYQSALRLFPLSDSGWRPRAMTCSAYTHAGIEDLWSTILAYFSRIEKNGYYAAHRRLQSKYWMMEAIRDGLEHRFFTHKGIAAELDSMERAVVEERVSSFVAAQNLLDMFFSGSFELEKGDE